MANSSTKCHPNSFPELSALANGAISPLWGLEEINYSSLFPGEDFVVPQTCQNTNSAFSSEHRHYLPHDGRMELPALPDSNVVDYFSGGGLDGLVGFDNVAYQPMNAAINGYTSSVLNCSPSPYHVATNLGSWGNRSDQKMMSAHVGGVENTTRVGRYSVEERRDRILRYLKKRNQRNFNKTIKYVCRKTLADRRARVRGRFAKNNEDDHSNKSSPVNNEAMTISPCSYYDYANHDNQVIQKKEEGEDEWLQEAIASLMMCNMAAPYHHHLSHWQTPGGLPLH